MKMKYESVVTGATFRDQPGILSILKETCWSSWRDNGSYKNSFVEFDNDLLTIGAFQAINIQKLREILMHFWFTGFERMFNDMETKTAPSSRKSSAEHDNIGSSCVI